jgi:hypothetical protein
VLDKWSNGLECIVGQRGIRNRQVIDWTGHGSVVGGWVDVDDVLLV